MSGRGGRPLRASRERPGRCPCSRQKRASWDSGVVLCVQDAAVGAGGRNREGLAPAWPISSAGARPRRAACRLAVAARPWLRLRRRCQRQAGLGDASRDDGREWAVPASRCAYGSGEEAHISATKRVPQRLPGMRGARMDALRTSSPPRGAPGGVLRRSRVAPSAPFAECARSRGGLGRRLWSSAPAEPFDLARAAKQSVEHVR